MLIWWKSRAPEGGSMCTSGFSLLPGSNDGTEPEWGRKDMAQEASVEGQKLGGHAS